MTGKRGNKNFYKGIFFNLLLVNSKDILRMLLKSALFKLIISHPNLAKGRGGGGRSWVCCCKGVNLYKMSNSHSCFDWFLLMMYICTTRHTVFVSLLYKRNGFDVAIFVQ